MFRPEKLLHSLSRLGEFMQKRSVYLFGTAAVKSDFDTPNYQYLLGTNSAQFTDGDVVTETAGFLAVAGANSRPLGIAKLSATMTASNQTVAKQEVPYIPASYELTFEMDFNASAAAADVGAFFQLTGATGAQQVNYSTLSATVGPVVLVKLDPRGEGSVVRGLFRFAKGFQSYTVA